MKSTMRILSVVEATTVNAVAKITLEFFRTAREVTDTSLDRPIIDGSIVTFSRDSSENEFIQTVRAAGIPIDIIAERGRFDLGVLPALRSIIEQRQPDIVITQSVKSHFLMWRSRLWKKIPMDCLSPRLHVHGFQDATLQSFRSLVATEIRFGDDSL
jgi:hypothetical protein